MYCFYSMYSVQALQENRTPNQHPLENFTEELFLKRATEKALRLTYTIHILFHIFILIHF